MGVLSGLEGIIVQTLKKTKPEKKDSIHVKALEYSFKGITYPINGTFPAEIQEKEGKKAEINPLKFTKYSIVATVLSGCAKYIFAWKAEGIPVMEHFSSFFEYWALIGNITSIA